jgi:hypothetical protein
MKKIYFCIKICKFFIMMKKTTFLIASLLMLVSIKLNAQNERVLLFECFTNTSCGPCAQYNPGLDALINNNGDRVAAIKYHMNWPGANDPMYLHNTTDNNSRKSTYNVNSVPHTVVDGIRYSGNPGNLNQGMVNNWLPIESPLEMRLRCDVDEAANTVTVHVMGRASTDIAATSKLYVGVIEKEIHYTSAPGNNGERDFYSVMKKLLPSASGTSLGSLVAGDYFAYSFTWEMANVYDVNVIDAIAWVQNPDTKEVYQACKSSESLVPFYDYEAAISGLSNVKNMNCSGVAEPIITVINNGNLPLTSAELEVLVNNEVVKTMDWTGNLGLFEETNIELGQVDFSVLENNTLQVRIVSVNGTTDQATNNNMFSTNFNGSPENSNVTMKLTIRTDANPQETSWRLTNLTTSEVVQEGGPYTDANHNYTEILEISDDGCYDLTIFDAGGDGLTGTGMYYLKAGNKTLFSGNSFGNSVSNEFSYGAAFSVEEAQDETTRIFPNPTTGLINVVCQGEQTVAVYNLTGQCVYTGVAEGQLQIDLSSFGAGVYAVKVGDKAWRTVVK